MSLLRRYKVSHRLAFLVISFLMGIVLYAAWSFVEMSKYKINGPVYKTIINGKDLIADILPPPEYILESYLVSFQLSSEDNKDEIAALSKKLADLKEEYLKRQAFWAKEELPTDIKNLISNDSYHPAMAFYKTALEELIPAVKAQDKPAIQTIMNKLKQSYQQHRSAIDRLVQITNTYAAEIEKNSNAGMQMATYGSILLLLIFVSFGTLVSRAIFLSITRPLEEAVSIAEHVARGNLKLSVKVDYDDEIGHLFVALKNMVEHLSSTLIQVRESAHTISTISEDMELENRNLSIRTEEQTKALNTTTHAMSNLTNAVKQNSENASQAHQLVIATSHVAHAGGDVVNAVVKTMGTITQSSHKIVDIISVIDGIAFQTNILALNAAVEAARAGEQGRGFAVVASEVRNLAQRSASAAKEIKELITDSVENVNTGSNLVEQAGVNMQKIVVSVQQVADLMSEIAAASRDQNSGIEQVNFSIGQMDEITQQNSLLVKESTLTAENMNGEAQNLLAGVVQFQIST